MAIPSTTVMIKAYDDREGDINIMVTRISVEVGV
ncbi:MAG: hypothetical protein Ct9H300mP3_06150 [Gammaproteobacteria bacterium]|nr:MAG: hypothetical protein Ct9H300mP3_06150 [Gammaproteobacteria bacterium]